MKVFTKGVILLFVFSFVFILFVEARGTTLRGDVLSYNNPGVINNLQNITVQNHSLVIIDGVDGSLKAYFNAQPGQFPTVITQSFPPSFSSNTTTGFIGDVDNFDNVNGFSRFKETNLNNGPDARSGFIAVNDIEDNITFGIASSNFKFGNRFLNRTGAVVLDAPNIMIFLNAQSRNCVWFTDNDPGPGIQTPMPVMNLSNDGDLGIDGNFTHNGTITFPHFSEPPPLTDHVLMWCESDNRCFFEEDDGDKRRILTSASGSDIIDYVIDFNVSPVMEFMNETFVGGSAYVCIWDNGSLYSSEAGC